MRKEYVKVSQNRYSDPSSSSGNTIIRSGFLLLEELSILRDEAEMEMRLSKVEGSQQQNENNTLIMLKIKQSGKTNRRG